MILPILQEFSITDIFESDKPAYLEHLREKEIHDNTLNIPYPYREADADWWIQHVAEEGRRHGRSLNWAIRRRDGYLIGGIGYHDFDVGASHRGEIGYWLAKPFWGLGIMTEAVRRATEFGFTELGLIRVTAHVFVFNAASARVLEKAGFQREGLLRKHSKKGDRLIDTLLYARVRED